MWGGEELYIVDLYIVDLVVESLSASRVNGRLGGAGCCPRERRKGEEKVGKAAWGGRGLGLFRIIVS